MSIGKKGQLSCLARVLALMVLFVSAPPAFAGGGYPYLYVVNQDDFSLSIVDTGTYGLVAKIQFPIYDSVGVASPDGSKVYIANQNDGTVAVIDTGTNTITSTISTTVGGSNAIAITPDGGKLYLSSVRNSTISVISTATQSIVATISAPESVQFMAITPDGRQLYTANSAGNTANVIDTSSDSVVATIQTGLIGEGIAISPDGRRVYINGLGLASDPGLGNEYQVAVIDAGTRTLITKIASASLFDASGVVVSADGSRLYVPNREGTISIILTSINSIVGSFEPFTESLRSLAITPSGSYLYASGQNNFTVQNHLLVIDPNTDMTVETIPGLTSGSGLTVFFGPPRGQSELAITVAGNGQGQVTSSPSGIACPTSCSASFSTTARVTLNATAADGSSFAGWSGGGCVGVEPCTIALNGDAAVSANFVTKTSTTIALASAILPSGRSVQAGSVATVFGTIINAGPETATNCFVTPTSNPFVTFGFQTTDPATNALTGTANAVVDIPAGKSQSFVLAFTPTVTFSPSDVAITFACSNANPAPSYSGINTLLLSSSATPPLDVIGLAATATNDGIIHIGSQGSGAFAVAAANVGSSGTVLAVADTGQAALPLTLTICQTDPFTGVCFRPPSQVASAAFNSDETATYSIFAAAKGAIPFLPAVNRIYVRFVDTAGVLRGSTSVAVTTQ